MKTVIRNSYTPKIGDYCNKIVVDKETGNIYIFDTDGVFTEFGDADIDIEDIIRQAVEQSEEYTDEVARTKVNKEARKGLSSNDFTDAEKEKLSSVEAGAEENVIEVVKRNGSALTVTDKTVDILVPTKTSDLTNDSGFVINTVDDLANYYTKTQTDDAIALETTAREGADQNLQEQIDAIAAGSDVVDIVGTYAELQAYDTSKLHNNDIIKVLSDETRSGATTYYRWSTTAEDFSYIGSQGPFYTKSESDSTFVPQTRTVNGKALSSDITLTATDVGALPNSTVIPTVNDATLTIQKNGTTVTTFTANSATNTTANIAVPTKTSDLTNDGADGTDTYVEAGDLAAVATSGAYADLTGKPSIPTKTSDLTNDSDFVSDANYVHTDNNFTTTLKNKLDGIAAGAEVNVQSDWAQTDNTADDYIKNKPSIPTKTSDLTNDSGFITSAALPTKTSDLTNDTGFITKSVSDLTNYYDQTVINNMFNALSVPTKTSDLTNDSGFITNTDYASASTGGVVKVGSGLSIDANGVLSSNGLTSVDWADVTNKPTNVSYWANDAGYITSAALPTKTSDLTNDSGFITSAALPTKTSDLTNDSGYITSSVNNLTNYYTKGDTYTQSEVNSLLSAITIPTKTSDLTNDGSDGTSTYVEASDLATVATTGSYNDLSNKPTIPTVNNATLTIQKNGTTVNTFTANASSNVTANITVPTNTSELTNNSGFLTSSNAVILDDTIMNTNPFGGRKLYINSIDNAMASADKKYYVTVTTHKKTVNGVTYPYVKSGASVTDDEYWVDSPVVSTLDARNIFDGNYETNLIVPAGHYAKIHIQFNDSATWTPSTGSTFAGYPYGTYYLSYYYTDQPEKAQVRTYNKYSAHTLGWKIATFSDFKRSSTELIQQLTDSYNYQRSCLEFLIFSKDSAAAKPTQIDWKLQRPHLSRDGATVTKYGAQKLYHTFSWGDQDSDNVVINPAGTITATTFNGNATSATKATQDGNGANIASTYAKKTEIPTVNNATLTIQKNGTNVQTFTANASSNVTANITVPTKTSDLTNDSGFLDSVAWGDVTGKPTFATVATSGSYNDLTNKPTIPAAVTVDSALSSTSTNPVQNKVINTALNGKQASLSTAQLNAANSGITSAKVTTYDNYAGQIAGKADLSALDDKQDALTAGDHIDITNDTISATGYVHSENPVTTTSSTATVTGSMIANGTITADKLATGATLKLTLSTTDIGEGAALAANTLYGVYQ